MKRKPDTMLALVLLFVLGLAVTGITQVLADDERALSQQYSLHVEPAAWRY